MPEIHGSKEKIGSYRWMICALLFFVTTVNYLDRQVLGILKPLLDTQIGLGEKEYSYIVMAFQAAYALGLIFVGSFIDKVGTKLGYATSIVIWGFSSMSHALARTPIGFGFARFGLGIGESGNFPAAVKTVAEWFPKKERALATGIFNSGTAIGAVIAPVAIPWVIYYFAADPSHPAWQMAFIFTGLLDLVGLIFWLMIYNKPENTKKLKPSELAYINSDIEMDNTSKDKDAKISWKKIIALRQTWGFTIAKSLTDCAWWFYLFWLPSFLNDKYHVDIKDFKNFALPLIIIYGLTMIGSIYGGWMSSSLIKRGWTINKARKFTMLLFALLVLPIYLVRYVSLWPAVMIIGLAMAFHQAWSANLLTTISDIFPKKATASATSIGTMFATIVSLLFSYNIGSVLDYWKRMGHVEAGYSILFTFCALAYIIGWTVFNLLIPKLEPLKLD
jgi:MFS transporter, ACS family, hexuronate transporter